MICPNGHEVGDPPSTWNCPIIRCLCVEQLAEWVMDATAPVKPDVLAWWEANGDEF